MAPRFTICKASAGAGKTYTLVRQYIEIAISSPSCVEDRFKHILAITFTNKAANGMKHRILLKLKQIVTLNRNADDLVDEISRNLAITPQETRRRCAILHRAIMHNYSDFAVCTIDSFVHRIVRTFAHDLHMPMNFNVMVDDSELVKSSVDSLIALSGLPDEKSLTKVLCGFAESKMEDGWSFNIGKELTAITKELLKEEAPEFLKMLANKNPDAFLSARDQMLHDNNLFVKAISEAASSVVNACSTEKLSANDFIYGNIGGIYPYFSRLASGDMSRINDSFARVENCIDTGTFYKKDTPEHIRAAIDRISPQIVASYNKIEELKKKHLREYNTRKYLLANIFSLALLGRIQSLKDAWYNENGIVHISEFNKSISEKVCDEPAPFIYERIGSRYHNYLIDEFQDTSKLQWLNFLPLLDEAMSHRFSADSASSGQTSLVVGDGKQAIYRFRQGDVRQFIKLPKVDSKLHGLSLEPNAKIEPMTMNYRTLSEVVEFNNTFFESVVSHFYDKNTEIKDLYIIKDRQPDQKAALEQKWKEKGGYVGLCFVPEEEWFQSIRTVIRRQVDELGYSYGDILVLARTNKTLAAIGNYLMDPTYGEPIPVVSSESFVLKSSRVILLLRSALRHLHLGQSDPPSAVSVVRLLAELYNMQPEKIDSMLWCLRHENYNLQSALLEWDVDFNTEYLKSLSLYDCCEELLRRFRLEGMDTAYVAAFLGQVYSYTQRTQNYAKFIDDIDELIAKRSASTSTDLDAVNLMTIHKAKGLENKIVILAVPADGSREQYIWVKTPEKASMPIPITWLGVTKSMNTSLFDDQVMEECQMREMDDLNVLYVALTRPEHKLFVCCNEKATNSSAELLRWFVKEKAGGCTSFGIDHPRPTKTNSNSDAESETNSQFSISNISFSPWEDRIMIAPPEKARLEMADTPRRQGIVIHSLLSSIATDDDVAPVVAQYCKTAPMPEDAQLLTDRILAMIRNPENSPFFRPGLHIACESPIMCGTKVRIPDRIVFGDNETWVIDFKTGEFNEVSHSKYEKQVDEYATALSAMGYPNVKTRIIYF